MDGTTGLRSEQQTSQTYVRLYLGGRQGWVEYRPNARVRLRFGKMLQPFGILNELHDKTPLFHSVFPPDAVYGKHAPIPELGEARLSTKLAPGVSLRLSGEVEPGDVSLEAVLSNGRGRDPGSDEDNANKGIGARAVFTDSGERLRAGASIYADRNGLQDHSKQTHVGLDLTVAPRGIDSGPVLTSAAS